MPLLLAQTGVHWVPESFEMAILSSLAFGGVGRLC